MIGYLKKFKAWMESVTAASAEQVAERKEMTRVLAARHAQLETMLNILGERHTHLENLVTANLPSKLERLSPHYFRNTLPNDDAALQKSLMASWRLQGRILLDHAELMNSGFRAFSQNDEDGVLLRLFTHIGATNRYVIEIGSNCNGSDIGIPENLSANLIVNHGWHGAVFEMDPAECEKMRYFFARDHATRHFHWEREGQHTYFSPLVIQQAVSPENINELLLAANVQPEPDLMILDIDGGDYAVMKAVTAVRPRVLVVEFEKRFRGQHSVVQRDRNDFSRKWQQSGTVSLPAWRKLLEPRGYILAAVGSCGFNAFFVRSDVAVDKLLPVEPAHVFDTHPVFSTMPADFWLSPDDTWTAV
jgi:hypothetical protein